MARRFTKLATAVIRRDGDGGIGEGRNREVGLAVPIEVRGGHGAGVGLHVVGRRFLGGSVPLFVNAEALPTRSLFVTARSGLPSPLRTRATTELGLAPDSYSTAFLKVPSPSFINTEASPYSIS